MQLVKKENIKTLHQLPENNDKEKFKFDFPKEEASLVRELMFPILAALLVPILFGVIYIIESIKKVWKLIV